MNILYPVYLKNYRKGFATNSSSTHSVIYKNKDDMFNDLNIFEYDYYDRCDNTIAASKEAKIKYIAANIMYNDKLYEIMSMYYPQMKEYSSLVKKALEKVDYSFGMYYRGQLYFVGNENIEASIDYLKYIIENDDIIIVGGSDEMDFVYDTVVGHKEIHQPNEISDDIITKNGNYWVGYNNFIGKIRFSFNEDNKLIPEYPELIDLKITDKCEHGCKFCYMDANMNGKHADIDFLKNLVKQLGLLENCNNKKRVEFSIGGGNILLYPNLSELFEYIHENGHIVNTTINAKDCKKILDDENLFDVFKKYVNGIGVSVTSTDDLVLVKSLYDKIYEKYNIVKKQLVIHLIPELLGKELTCEIIKKGRTLHLHEYLLLGFKSTGRGALQNPITFNNYDLNNIFDKSNWISVDTTFAKTYKDWIEKNYETEHTITFNEGEFSMYIDGVNKYAYKSSYQLEKPYNMSIERWTNKECKDYNNIIGIFQSIRKDNGFETYEK